MQISLLLLLTFASATTNVAGLSLVSGSRPYINDFCPDDVQQQPTVMKRLNETCNTDSDCFAGGSPVICANDKTCQCPKGHFAQRPSMGMSIFEMSQDMNDEYYCRPLPSFYEPCDTECMSPLQCTEPSVDYGTVNLPVDAPPVPSNELFVDDGGMSIAVPPPMAPPRGFMGYVGKVCQCLSPYQLINGVCQLECKNDEFYADLQCHKKCSDDQMLTKDYTCQSRVGLDQACETDEQCINVFSECSSNKCACRSGFLRSGDSCVATSYNCMHGTALTNSDGSLMTCLYKDPSILSFTVSEIVQLQTLNGMMDVNFAATSSIVGTQNGANCSANAYCQPFDDRYASNSVSGVCCPKPKSACPSGDSHPSAVCTIVTMLPFTTMLPTTSNATSCPTNTHFCYNAPGTENMLCCPRPCPEGYVQSQGKCLRASMIGEACQTDEQCTGNSVCVNNNCTCTDKTTLINLGPANSFCKAVCNANEVEFNNQCYASKQLGDDCSTEAFRCPSSSYCNSKMKCACPCGTVQLNGTLCVAPPSCPMVNGMNVGGPSISVIQSFMNNFEGNFWSPSSTVNQPSAKEQFDNATFCTIAGQQAPLSRAGQCPTDQYCSSYVQDMGVCCPVQPPSCPSGHEVGEPCNIIDPSACNETSFCNQYIYPTDLSTPNAVCCTPKSRPYELWEGYRENKFFGKNFWACQTVLADTKCYHVIGKIACRKDPQLATDIEIHLMDDDGRMNNDDQMGWTTTAEDGTFRVEGCGYDFLTSPDPYLKIFNVCNGRTFITKSYLPQTPTPEVIQAGEIVLDI